MEVKEIMQRYGIDEDVISEKTFEEAIEVETEHGGDLETTVRIVLDHLEEHYLYYEHLKVMEEKLKKIPNKSIYKTFKQMLKGFLAEAELSILGRRKIDDLDEQFKIILEYGERHGDPKIVDCMRRSNIKKMKDIDRLWKMI